MKTKLFVYLTQYPLIVPGEEFPDLFEAYMVKETFRDIYLTAEDKIQATRMLNAWIGTIPDWERFHAMRNTFTIRKENVLNYWNYHWTNVYTKSINNRIKLLRRLEEDTSLILFVSVVYWRLTLLVLKDLIQEKQLI